MSNPRKIVKKINQPYQQQQPQRPVPSVKAPEEVQEPVLTEEPNTEELDAEKTTQETEVVSEAEVDSELPEETSPEVVEKEETVNLETVEPEKIAEPEEISQNEVTAVPEPPVTAAPEPAVAPSPVEENVTSDPLVEKTDIIRAFVFDNIIDSQLLDLGGLSEMSRYPLVEILTDYLVNLENPRQLIESVNLAKHSPVQYDRVCVKLLNSLKISEKLRMTRPELENDVMHMLVARLREGFAKNPNILKKKKG